MGDEYTSTVYAAELQGISQTLQIAQKDREAAKLSSHLYRQSSSYPFLRQAYRQVRCLSTQ